MDLSRAEFEKSCMDLIQEHSQTEPGEGLGPHLFCRGWRWYEHPIFPNLGFLHRQLFRSKTSAQTLAQEDDIVEMLSGQSPGETDDDCQATPSSHLSRVVVDLSACYSPSYRCPVLYFNAHDPSGSTLSLNALLQSNILRYRPAGSTPETYPFNTLSAFQPSPSPLDTEQDGPASFPFLSQGEHPSTSHPCFFLHPCETQAMVDELLTNDQSLQAGGSLDGRQQRVRRLEAWLNLVDSIVDLRD